LARDDVARYVTAPVKGRELCPRQFTHQRSQVLDAKPVQLESLARRDRDAAHPIPLGDGRKSANLRCRQDAGREHDPGHEVAWLARVVDAIPLADERLLVGHRSPPRHLVEIQQQAGLLDRLLVASSEIPDAPLHGYTPVNEIPSFPGIYREGKRGVARPTCVRMSRLAGIGLLA